MLHRLTVQLKRRLAVHVMQVRATVITAVEEEHLEALGGSIESIVAAKAGIVKPGGCVIVAPQPLHRAAQALQVALREQQAGTVIDASPCIPEMLELVWDGVLLPTMPCRLAAGCTAPIPLPMRSSSCKLQQFL
jgi:hypothetical protein